MQDYRNLVKKEDLVPGVITLTGLYTSQYGQRTAELKLRLKSVPKSKSVVFDKSALKYGKTLTCFMPAGDDTTLEDAQALLANGNFTMREVYSNNVKDVLEFYQIKAIASTASKHAGCTIEKYQNDREVRPSKDKPVTLDTWGQRQYRGVFLAEAGTEGAKDLDFRYEGGQEDAEALHATKETASATGGN